MSRDSVNPIARLGLSVEFLRGVPAEQRAPIIKAQYRALAAFYHPDKLTGDATLAGQINEAWDQVNPDHNLDEFSRWLEIYLRPRKGEAAVREAEDRAAALSQSLVQWENEALRRLISLAAMDGMAWSGDGTSSTVYSKSKSLPISLLHRATVLVTKKMGGSTTASDALPAGREDSSSIVALRVASSGEIQTCAVRQIWRKHRDEELPAGIPESRYDSKNWHQSYVARLEGSFAQLLPRTLRVVGCLFEGKGLIPSAYWSRRESDLRLLMNNKPSSEGRVNTSDDGMLGISEQEMRSIALHVSPVIVRGGLLIAGEYHPDGDEAAQREGPKPRFFVLGQVRFPPALDYNQEQ